MNRTIAVALLCCTIVACNRKEQAGNKPQPGETIEARLMLPDNWKHGKNAPLSVAYEVNRPNRAEPIQLEAADLPTDFLPDLYVTFEKDGTAIGEPLRLFFDPDC